MRGEDQPFCRIQNGRKWDKTAQLRTGYSQLGGSPKGYLPSKNGEINHVSGDMQSDTATMHRLYCKCTVLESDTLRSTIPSTMHQPKTSS